MASQSHSSLDSTNYQCYRKLEFCSAESVDSTYYHDQNLSQPQVSWKELNQWGKRVPRAEFNDMSSSGTVQRPMLGNLVPIWQQHSFECWQAPSRTPPKQHSLDLSSSSRRHTSQQFFHSKGKNCINFNSPTDQKRRSTPQHYRKIHSKNSMSFGFDQIKHASSYTLENNTSYPPETVGTPLASRRQWFVKSSRKSDGSTARKAESNASSPQSPLMPLENLQSFKRSKNNVQIGINKYAGHNSSTYKQYSLDLPLHSYNNSRNIQCKEEMYIPELIIPMPQSVQGKTKISPDFKVDTYKREKALSRQKYYNSCKHIYSH
ncbi:hypothetical protein X975_14185, partial [Stegodyphus mimosarum]